MYSQQDLDQLLSRGQISQAAYMQGVQALQGSGGLGASLAAQPAAPAPQAPQAPAPAPAAPSMMSGALRLFTGQPPLSAPQSPGIGGFLRSYAQPAAPAAPMAAPLDGDSPESPAPPPALSRPPAGSPAAKAAEESQARAASEKATPGLDPAIMAQLASGAPQQTRAVGLSPADRKDLKEREDLEKRRQEEATSTLDALKTNADTAAEQSQNLAVDTQLAAFNAKKDQERDTERMGEVRRDTKEASTRLQAELADMQAQGIDPNRYWQNQSTPSKIGAALAIGLGTFGQALGHQSTNTALDIINGAVTRDLDAQKANMQKNMQLAQIKASKLGQDFDMESAMAKAERESHQAAWGVALADLDRRASLFKDNATAMAQYQTIRAGVVAKAQEGEEGKIQNEYAVRKRSEQQVPVAGAGGLTSKEVLAKADKIVEDYAAKGVPLSRPQSLRLALEGLTGRPAGPEGFAQVPVMPQKGAAGVGQLDKRNARVVGEIDAKIKSLHDLKGIVSGTSSLNPSNHARYEQLQNELKGGGVEIPNAPFGRWGMGTEASIDQAIEAQQEKRDAIVARVTGAQSDAPGAANETP